MGVVAAVVEINDEWKSSHPSSTCKTQLTLPFNQSFDVASIDLDMVIQGLDLEDLTAENQRKIFSLDLVKEIRRGLNDYLTPSVPDIDKIDVTISAGPTPSSFFVTTKVPVWDDGVTSPSLSYLQDHLSDMFLRVEKNIQSLESLKFFSSWTKENVKVTAPGVMVDVLA